VVKDIVFIASDLNQTEKYARQLVNRTLTSFESVIKIVAVKIDHDKTVPLASFNYHCTILVKNSLPSSLYTRVDRDIAEKFADNDESHLKLIFDVRKGFIVCDDIPQ